MSQTTVNLGMVPNNRGEYNSAETYYKDNIVQYNGSSYICTAAMDLEHPSGITGIAPYDSDPTQPNTGWAVFVNNQGGGDDGIYDVSAAHMTDNTPKSYNSLSDALADIIVAKRKGGMSMRFLLQLYTVVKSTTDTSPASDVRYNEITYDLPDSGTHVASDFPSAFSTNLAGLVAGTASYYYKEESGGTYTTWTVTKVQTFDNNYVQYRYMGTATTGSPNPFLNTANWQGIDDVPTAGSNNLVKSGGLYPVYENIDVRGVVDIEGELIEIRNDDGVVIHSIGSNSADFKNLKSNGYDVLVPSDISGKQDIIPDLSQTVTPEEEDVITFEDNAGNVVGTINENGVDFINITENGKRVVATDSISEDSTSDADSIIEVRNENENTIAAIQKDERLHLKYPLICEEDETTLNINTLRTIIEGLDLSYYPINGNVVCLGDSTVAGYLNNTRVSSLLNISGTLNDISTAGDTILGQKSKWTNLSQSVKNDANFIFIEIGLNDLTAEDVVRYENYQALINTIRADSPNAKIIICTMSPALQRFKVLFPNDWEEKYNNWLETNNSIKNNLFFGSSVSVNFHTYILGDNYGNLLPQYEYSTPDHIHLNTSGVKVIAWSWLSGVYKL